MKKDTLLVSTGRRKRYTGPTVNPVVARASTIVFDSMSEMARATSDKDYLYPVSYTHLTLPTILLV